MSTCRAHFFFFFQINGIRDKNDFPHFPTFGMEMFQSLEKKLSIRPSLRKQLKTFYEDNRKWMAVQIARDDNPGALPELTSSWR